MFLEYVVTWPISSSDEIQKQIHRNLKCDRVYYLFIYEVLDP